MQYHRQGSDDRKGDNDGGPGTNAPCKQHLHQNISGESMNYIERVTDVCPKSDRRDRSYYIGESHCGGKDHSGRNKTQQKRVVSQNIEMLCNPKHQHHTEHDKSKTRGSTFTAVQIVKRNACLLYTSDAADDLLC